MVIVTCAPNRLTFDCADIINVPSKIRPCIIMVGNPTPVRGILDFGGPRAGFFPEFLGQGLDFLPKSHLTLNE